MGILQSLKGSNPFMSARKDPETYRPWHTGLLIVAMLCSLAYIAVLGVTYDDDGNQTHSLTVVPNDPTTRGVVSLADGIDSLINMPVEIEAFTAGGQGVAFDMVRRCVDPETLELVDEIVRVDAAEATVQTRLCFGVVSECTGIYLRPQMTESTTFLVRTGSAQDVRTPSSASSDPRPYWVKLVVPNVYTSVQATFSQFLQRDERKTNTLRLNFLEQLDIADPADGADGSGGDPTVICPCAGTVVTVGGLTSPLCQPFVRLRLAEFTQFVDITRPQPLDVFGVVGGFVSLVMLVLKGFDMFLASFASNDSTLTPLQMSKATDAAKKRAAHVQTRNVAMDTPPTAVRDAGAYRGEYDGGYDQEYARGYGGDYGHDGYGHDAHSRGGGGNAGYQEDGYEMRPVYHHRDATPWERDQAHAARESDW